MVKRRVNIMQYLCEFELINSDEWICVLPFGLEGATQGKDAAEAAYMAADLLKSSVEGYLITGQPIPQFPLGNKPQAGGRILLVSIETSLDNVETVNAAKAAILLGVSRSRISQMLKSGQLLGYKRGRDAFVSTESIKARLAEKPKAGRPKKNIAAIF